MGTGTQERGAELARMMGGDRLARPAYPLAADGTAGRRDPSPSWDPWYCLPLARRRSLVRYMAPAGDRGGLLLDQVADLIGAGSLEEALARWAAACTMARATDAGWDLTPAEIDDWAAADALASSDAELYGPQELAARWGISTPALAKRKERGQTPAPDLTISKVPIWTGETIRHFEEAAAWELGEELGS